MCAHIVGKNTKEDGDGEDARLSMLAGLLGIDAHSVKNHSMRKVV